MKKKTELGALASPSMKAGDAMEGSGMGLDTGSGAHLGSAESLETVDGEVQSPAAEMASRKRSLDGDEAQDHYRSVPPEQSFPTLEDAGTEDVGSEAVLGQEGEGDELPVLEDENDAGGDLKGGKALKTEIPDSEADMEEAVSPVRGAGVGGRARDPDADVIAGRQGGDNSAVERANGAGSMHGHEDPVVVDENIATSIRVDGSPAMMSRETSQDPENSLPTKNVYDDISPAPSNDQDTQHSEEIVTTYAANPDSSAVSFVDDDSMIILPQLTTSDLQPTHTPTQTQTQEDVVMTSQFADAVVVMPDLGGGTQDLMSAVDDPGVKGADAVMLSFDELGDEGQESAKGETADSAVKLDQNQIEDDGSRDPRHSESGPSDAALTSVMEPDSASEKEPSTADKEDNAVSEAPEEDDIVMSDEPIHMQMESEESNLSPAKDEDTTDVEMTSDAPGLATTKSIAARSISDSDDEDDHPNAEPSSKEAEEQFISQDPTQFKANERDTLVNVAPSPNKAISSKPLLPPKTPNTSFKASSPSKTNDSRSPEPTSSPSTPEVTTSTPSKAKQEKNNSPSKSFSGSEASQNKDILMAELKAIKIASIQARNASLEAEIQKKKARLEEVTKELNYPAADTVKNHIKLLHDYNDIRDVGQGLVGMIADNRGVRIGELYEEFGVGLKD